MRNIILAGFLVICMTPALTYAGDFDGATPLICATLETFECAPGMDCIRGTAQSINIPQFLWIDFKKKLIQGTKADGTTGTADIEKKTLADGKLILQGVQNGRGWSMVISEATGKMTLSASDDEAGFVVFCACTPD
jgi:hypothetical protein